MYDIPYGKEQAGRPPTQLLLAVGVAVGVAVEVAVKVAVGVAVVVEELHTSMYSQIARIRFALCDTVNLKFSSGSNRLNPLGKLLGLPEKGVSWGWCQGSFLL